LRCNICQQEFANPLKPIGKSENFLKKNGCLIFVIFLVIISAISYITDGGERIIADGTTVYTITKNIYAPSTEAAAKAMINSIARNGNDQISNLEYVYNNEADFTHVFSNDKVVVIRKTSSGYLIRKLRDYQTAVVPNDSYLKE
jgi:exopolysaccharide biosynthesis protein